VNVTCKEYTTRRNFQLQISMKVIVKIAWGCQKHLDKEKKIVSQMDTKR
jgi:hypothetical protein